MPAISRRRRLVQSCNCSSDCRKNMKNAGDTCTLTIHKRFDISAASPLLENGAAFSTAAPWIQANYDMMTAQEGWRRPAGLSKEWPLHTHCHLQQAGRFDQSAQVSNAIKSSYSHGASSCMMIAHPPQLLNAFTSCN